MKIGDHFELAMMGDAPRDGSPVAVVSVVRWNAYKPRSEQARRGLAGRWQEFDGYGWRNCTNEPEEWLRPMPRPGIAG